MTTAAPDAGVGRRASADWIIIYDGNCDFCLRCVRFLASWDTHHRLRMVPFQDSATLARLPVIPLTALALAMHLVTPSGGVLAGAEAAPAILRLLPGGRPLAALFRLPGIPALAARLYETVARNRHGLGCGLASGARGC